MMFLWGLESHAPKQALGLLQLLRLQSNANCARKAPPDAEVSSDWLFFIAHIWKDWDMEESKTGCAYCARRFRALNCVSLDFSFVKTFILYFFGRWHHLHCKVRLSRK